ncbi:hypothetical protein [Pseudomonas anguilliseptica]|uniref:hypothetical protein n=1 Tax=Pseudomonas anguilliseptica TaxID=53406 RepID=UPI00325B4A2F
MERLHLTDPSGPLVPHHPLRSKVIDCFSSSWKRASPHHTMRAVEFLTSIYDRFRAAGLADPHFEKELASGKADTYAQRVAELLLADMLWNDGFSLESSPQGPDFYVSKGGKSAWLELHTPIPNGVPSTLFTGSGGVMGFPHEKINLRWTNAISEKARKLEGYLEKGIVRPDDGYVIVVNSSLLAPGPSGGLHGVSQFPVPVEVLFGVGPIEVEIDRVTGEILDQRNQHRPMITKSPTVGVPADTFLDKKFTAVSAVLGFLSESKKD